MKDKQGECPSLFMPTGRRGNVTQAQQPLSVGSSHVGKEQPGHTAHPPLCLLLDTFWGFFCFFLYILIMSNSGRGNTCIFKIISFYCFCNSNSNDMGEGQRLLTGPRGTICFHSCHGNIDHCLLLIQWIAKHPCWESNTRDSSWYKRKN